MQMNTTSVTIRRRTIGYVASLLALLLCAFSLPAHATSSASEDKPYEMQLLFTDAAAGADCSAELVLRTPQPNAFGYGAVRFLVEVSEAPEGAEISLLYADDNGERDWIADRYFPKNASLSVQAEANQHYAFTACFSHSGHYELTVSLWNIIEGTVIQAEQISFDLTAQVVNATGISLPPSVSLTVGQEDLLAFHVLPNGASVPPVSFSSSAPDIVAVTEEGVLTAMAPGVATVTITSESGISASCLITVTEDSPETLPSAPTSDTALPPAPDTEPGTEPMTEPAQTDRPDPFPDTEPPVSSPDTDTPTSSPTDASSSDDLIIPGQDVVSRFARALLYGAFLLLGIALLALIALLLLRQRAKKKMQKKKGAKSAKPKR